MAQAGMSSSSGPWRYPPDMESGGCGRIGPLRPRGKDFPPPPEPPAAPSRPDCGPNRAPLSPPHIPARARRSNPSPEARAATSTSLSPASTRSRTAPLSTRPAWRDIRSPPTQGNLSRRPPIFSFQILRGSPAQPDGGSAPCHLPPCATARSIDGRCCPLTAFKDAADDQSTAPTPATTPTPSGPIADLTSAPRRPCHLPADAPAHARPAGPPLSPPRGGTRPTRPRPGPR